MPRHTSIADLDWKRTAAQDEFYADVVLDTYDTAENPASSLWLIHGPATVRYVRYQDGAVACAINTTGWAWMVQYDPSDTVTI